MPMTGLLHFSPALGFCRSQKCVHYEYSVREKVKLQTMKLSALASPFMQQQDLWNTQRLFSTRWPICVLPYRCSAVKCRASLLPVQKIADSCIKGASETLRWSYGSLQGNPSAIKLISAVGVIVFALWGLGPLIRSSRKFFQKSNGSWRQSTSHYVLTSYLQPVFLWIGAMLVCRALDPIVMPSEASNLVKQRLLTFVRSLSTVLAFAYSLSSAIQQFQNFLVETSGQSNARNV